MVLNRRVCRLHFSVSSLLPSCAFLLDFTHFLHHVSLLSSQPVILHHQIICIFIINLFVSFMGQKVSVVHGVKSENFYQQGNAINEIWLGDVELISRLPFGDSELEQAGWPADDWPKIPWHQFIIPLKRELGAVSDTNMSSNSTACPCPALPWEHHLSGTGLFSHVGRMNRMTAYIIGILVVFIGGVICCDAFVNLYKTWKFLLRVRQDPMRVIPSKYTPYQLERYFVKRMFVIFSKLACAVLIFGVGMACMIRGIEGMSANLFFVAHLNGIVAMIPGISFPTSIFLHKHLRRTLAVQRRTADEQETTTDTALAPLNPTALTPEELHLPLAVAVTCPQCEKCTHFHSPDGPSMFRPRPTEQLQV